MRGAGTTRASRSPGPSVRMPLWSHGGGQSSPRAAKTGARALLPVGGDEELYHAPGGGKRERAQVPAGTACGTSDERRSAELLNRHPPQPPQGTPRSCCAERATICATPTRGRRLRYLKTPKREKTKKTFFWIVLHASHRPRRFSSTLGAPAAGKPDVQSMCARRPAAVRFGRTKGKTMYRGKKTKGGRES